MSAAICWAPAMLFLRPLRHGILSQIADLGTKWRAKTVARTRVESLVLASLSTALDDEMG